MESISFYNETDDDFARSIASTIVIAQEALADEKKRSLRSIRISAHFVLVTVILLVLKYFRAKYYTEKDDIFAKAATQRIHWENSGKGR